MLATRVDADKGSDSAHSEFPAGRYNAVGADVSDWDPGADAASSRQSGAGTWSPSSPPAPVTCPWPKRFAKRPTGWGPSTDLIVDVGVAGPQRLLAKLDRITTADAVVVVAGMEAALASVVGGHVACPVIAVPTSVGYGASFGGIAALLGMLNSCAANVSVVNIDAGFKAGYIAGMIAVRKQ